MDNIEKRIIEEVADLHEVPMGAYNFRINAATDSRKVSENIDIRTKEDNSGIDVIIKPYTKNESVHIPVVISVSGLTESVRNDFYVGEGADVLIVAGCGIHNCGDQNSEHDGIHRFFLKKNARVRYVEKHYGEGTGKGQRILNPVTEVTMEEGSHMEMEMVQIEGVDSTNRITRASLSDRAELIVRERLLTSGNQVALSEYTVELNGTGSSANILSRSVAKGHSYQKFISRIHGNNESAGHSACDSILMDEAKIEAIPEIIANSPDARLIHEAAIGKIAGEQLIKLMTLGLTEEEAEKRIVDGFLK